MTENVVDRLSKQRSPAPNSMHCSFLEAMLPAFQEYELMDLDRMEVRRALRIVMRILAQGRAVG